MKQFELHVHETELKESCPVIQGLSQILPSNRMSISEALQLITENCLSGRLSEESVDS